MVRLLVTLLAQGCSCAPPAAEAPAVEAPPIEAVAQTETWTLDGLSCPVQVVRTEGDIPHVYAENRADLARVYGFVMARHRYFEIDMARRLGAGTLSEVLGQDALASDKAARATGMTYVAARFEAAFTEEQRAIVEAFAAGIDDYVAEVQAGNLPLPSELELAGPFLGASDPSTLMRPFSAADIAAVAAVTLYQLGFETGDVGRASAADQLEGLFDGAALGELRQAGLYADVWAPVAPAVKVASAADWQPASRPLPYAAVPASSRVPAELLARATARLGRVERLLRHDHDNGWGSNAWAVSSRVSSDGTTLLAGDGHLPLTVPSMFYSVGLDTALLGGGDTHQAGLGLVGLPVLGVGTNGRVAWSQTQLFGDITDWYREELQLDANGAPAATLFQGEWMPLVAETESFVVADVPLLGSEGRTETLTRYVTFDGRWLYDIEGRSLAEGEEPGDGETAVDLQGDRVVPGDTDGDGVVTALSFDYAGLDAGNMLAAVDAFGHSDDVGELREATRGLVAYSQNVVAADADGGILYTGYQGVPCRGYLAREDDGAWADGADPSMLLDGTRYGGFTVPYVDGAIDESQGAADPYLCVVPFDEYPQSQDPEAGWVVTANNDPGGLSFDDSLTDDPWYIGGPWLEGYRARGIVEGLEGAVAGGTADEAGMAAVQADHRSPLGVQFGPLLLEAVAEAREAGSEGYLADPDGLDEVEARLTAWIDAGAPAASGVETFYHSVAEGEAEHAVATTIFNAWFGRFVSGVFDDEGFPGVWRPTSKDARMRVLTAMVDGRGDGNPLALASWNEDTRESAFFDVLGTEEVETSEDVALAALHDALAFLRSEPTGPGAGGFGTEDMDAWLWGLRHQAKFESILADFVGDEFSFLTESFSITTETLPLAEGMASDDPRAELTWFPRPGDNFGVDAANPGFGGESFTYSSGPVFRMVIALTPERTAGRNILPNGQSAMVESPHFADQAALWLGNDAWPIRFEVEDVIAGGVGREVYVPVEATGGCRW